MGTPPAKGVSFRQRASRRKRHGNLGRESQLFVSSYVLVRFLTRPTNHPRHALPDGIPRSKPVRPRSVMNKVTFVTRETPVKCGSCRAQPARRPACRLSRWTAAAKAGGRCAQGGRPTGSGIFRCGRASMGHFLVFYQKPGIAWLGTSVDCGWVILSWFDTRIVVPFWRGTRCRGSTGWGGRSENAHDDIWERTDGGPVTAA